MAGWSWGIVYALIWVYRSAFSVLAQTIVGRLTQLGDSQSYQQAAIPVLQLGQIDPIGTPRRIATWLTEAIGGVFYRLGGGDPILINIGFQTIAFIGIVAFLSSLRGRTRVVVALLLMLPSFSIWSSVAGKEAIVVLAMGVLGASIVRMYLGRSRFGPVQLSALIIIFLFKNHYLPALVFIFAGTFAARRVRQKEFLVLAGGLVSLAFLYLFEAQIAAQALEITKHFSLTGSTRAAFWQTSSDVLERAPLGMLLAFYGPTFAEASSGFLQMASFIESALLFVVLAFLTVRQLPRLPVYLVLMSGFTVFWILFAAYPFGVMNPGSAIRYRTGYEILVIVMIAAFLSPDLYRTWLSMPLQRLGIRVRTKSAT
jgi:hypothetical protein